MKFSPLFKAIFCGVLGSQILTSCSYNKEKVADKRLNATRNISAEVYNQASYDLVTKQVFQKYDCASCHDQQGDGMFQSLQSVQSKLKPIFDETIVKKSMPKGAGKLSLEDENLLYAWIELGGPEFARSRNFEPPATIPPSAEDPPKDPPKDLPPTFESVTKIFQLRKCFDCHIPEGRAESVPLSSAKELLESPRELVIPGDPDSSGLILSILPGARKPMPPNKPGYTALTEMEINLIKTWISNGAKD